MSRKRLFVTLAFCSLAVLLLGLRAVSLAFHAPPSPATTSTVSSGRDASAKLNHNTQAPLELEQASAIPDHVLYRMLFHDVYLRKQQALKALSEGKPDIASAWRYSYKRDANLSDDEASLLEEVADAAEAEVSQQDAKAHEIIARDRARYPNGKLPEGQTIQPPSPELVQMQADRNAMLLKFRDQLHSGMGDFEFGRLHAFLMRNLASKIKRTH
jgi:hypothetical protein